MSIRTQQPLYVLTGSGRRTRGRDARETNVRAARAVADAVRTTLGPKGMDKMLVDASGTVVVTNDGATILDQMDVDHPAARMVVEVAESQAEAVGDGATTAAILAGELLARAESLLDAGVHPTVVVEGYDEAVGVALATVEAVAVGGDDVDDETLARVAETSMTGTATGAADAAALAERVVAAVRRATADGRIDRDDVHLVARAGAGTSETRLIEGVAVDVEPMIETMPRSVADATVAVVDLKLDVRASAVDAEYTITSVDQLDAAIAAEETELRGYAAALADAGVDVVVGTKAIDDRVANHLARAGILAFENVSDRDARAVARAVGARRLGSLADFDANDLGHADAVDVERFGGNDLVVIEGGRTTSAVTLLLRGSTDHVVAELERTVGDAVESVAAAVESGGVVPGAGGTEVAVAAALRDAARGVEGRKQLAVEAFADAVEAVPRTLATNAGLDPIDALVDLRSRHERVGEGRAGVVTEGGEARAGDPVAAGILDPVAVKREALAAAAQAATIVLRIDDVIAADR
jgi:thermosome